MFSPNTARYHLLPQVRGSVKKSISMNPVRNLRLSVTYRFGDLKTSMKRVQRGIVNEDVMQGQSGSQQGGTTTTPES